MKQIFLLSFLVSLFVISPAIAAELLSDTPQCSVIHNQSERTVFIGVRTNYFIGNDGTKQRHEASLRLEPTQKQQICAKGPFYDGHRVEIILRTIIPLFDCKTKLGSDLFITQKKEGDIVKLSLNCS